MLDQKPIYKINEYHIKMAWEKWNKSRVNEWKVATAAATTASTTHCCCCLCLCVAHQFIDMHASCRPIFMHSVVIPSRKKRTTPWSQTMMFATDVVFLSISFYLTHRIAFYKCVDVDADADNRVIESTPIVLFGLDLEHTSAHFCRHFFDTLKRCTCHGGT